MVFVVTPNDTRDIQAWHQLGALQNQMRYQALDNYLREMRKMNEERFKNYQSIYSTLLQIAPRIAEMGPEAQEWWNKTAAEVQKVLMHTPTGMPALMPAGAPYDDASRQQFINDPKRVDDYLKGRQQRTQQNAQAASDPNNAGQNNAQQNAQSNPNAATQTSGQTNSINGSVLFPERDPHLELLNRIFRLDPPPESPFLKVARKSYPWLF